MCSPNRGPFDDGDLIGRSVPREQLVMIGVGGVIGFIASVLFVSCCVVYTSSKPNQSKKPIQVGSIEVAKLPLEATSKVDSPNEKTSRPEFENPQTSRKQPSMVHDPIQKRSDLLEEPSIAALVVRQLPIVESKNSNVAKSTDDENNALEPSSTVDSSVKEKSPVDRPQTKSPGGVKSNSARELDLLNELNDIVRDLDLRTMKGTYYAYTQKVNKSKPRRSLESFEATKDVGRKNIDIHPILELANTDENLYGLPFLRGNRCRINPSEIPWMTKISRDLTSARAVLSRARTDVSLRIDQEVARKLAQKHEWRKSEAVPALMQTVQADGRVARLQLLHTLAYTKSPAASRALAKRAVFELWDEARETAVRYLRDRNRDEFRHVLLYGLRYPWAPVAEHAGQALIALNDHGAIRPIIELLDEPSPSAPFQNRQGDWVVREMVRVNHMRNCKLCHAPSLADTDPIRGLVPVPGQSIPILYYSSPRQGDFVRADVTYIRQDFSLTHRVANLHPWPERQRFDYFVRQRKLCGIEALFSTVRPIDGSSGRPLPSYPQRETALTVLRKLTLVDMGSETKAWKMYYAETIEHAFADRNSAGDS